MFNSSTTQRNALRTSELYASAYNYLAAALVLVLYINLGTILQPKRVGVLLTKQAIGPLIGVVNRFMTMPALALGLGYLCLPQQSTLQLALIFSALAPSGGLANICIIFLKGNMHLSLVTTTLNNLCLLLALPAWLWILTRLLHKQVSLTLPYWSLGLAALALIAALLCGCILRLLVPKLSRQILRYLKPIALLLSLCLLLLTIGLNRFAYEQLTGRLLLASGALPLLGYLIAFSITWLCRRTSTDALTLSIEASVMNMSFSIALLQQCLEETQMDLVLLVPLTATVCSVLLVTLLYVARRCFGCHKRRDADAFDEQAYIEDTLAMT